MPKNKKAYDYHLLLRLLKYFKPHLGKFILAFVLMLFTTLTTLLLPLANGLAIDIMTDASLGYDYKVRVIVIGSALLLAIIGLAITISYFQSMMLQKIGQQITDEIRKQVFEHIEKLSIGQINLTPIGKLVTRATNDPGNISEMFTTTIVNLIRNFIMMISIVIIMFVLDYKMALITMVLIPLIVLSSYLFRTASRKAYRDVRNNVSDVNAFLNENLSGMKITQVFNQEDKKIKQFTNINELLKKSYFKEIRAFAIYRPLVYFLSMVATVLTIVFGVDAIFNGVLSIGLFVSFYVYVGLFFEPIQQIAEQFNSLQNGFASAEKIFTLLDTIPSVLDEEDALTLENIKGEIEFKNVWFFYLENEWVLKDVSFKIKPNETIAFVGATGSGKTTILQLLVRNYDIQKGEILIDGVNIKKIKRSCLRSFIGQMLQDVFLFSGTIKENITLKNEEINDEEIEKAVNYVGLDHFLKRFPEKLESVVQERGANFSSGERQLISFARAVVYKPTIMTLDEATANIDSESEAIIQDSLHKMMNISTMLIVAHRLSTIKHCDRIYLMQKGEIKEEGNHQELLKQKGLYYHLYKLQYDQKDN
ncbi:MAG: ABC transporter ATP-binding protein [Bacilli bacterium]